MYKPTTAVWQSSAASLFKITVLASALATIGLTTGCSSTQTTKPVKSTSSGLLDASSLDSMEDLLSATDMRAVEGDRLLILKHGDVWKRMTVGFKMDETHWDPRIEAQRSWFVSRQPFLDRLSARASRYLYHTVKEAERRGLPTELALLPIIESSYDPAATSSAAAAGLWQFIPSTGRIYGLRQTGMYDGRRDVVESTRAAYEFLGSLYNQFGSWELALAAYNAGPGRIQQAINRNQAAGLPTDYWSLKLPQETMNYVPRFIAVAQIIKSPQKYGVSLPPIANRPHFREVQVQGGVSLNQISAVTGLSRPELYALNPGHRGEVVDPSSPMRILIPADISPSVDAKLRALKPGSGGLWAGNTTPAAPTYTPPPAYQPATSVTTTVNKTGSSVGLAQTLNTPRAGTTTVRSSTAGATSRKPTPNSADGLAAFAASADVPSAPRIPVAVTQTANVKPVNVEPPISNKEKQDILATVKAEGEKETLAQALEPKATKAETEQVVQEIRAIAPKGTEIVDPYDGKIKLTAIQTSQSVAEQQGKENTVGFSYPKGLADSANVDADIAKRNEDKTFVKTDTDIVVAPPKGKRSTYTVIPGDTLAIIAAKNGVNWRDVAKWNQIDPNGTLLSGTTLYLYDAKPQVDGTTTAKADVKPTTYVVKPNDSLTSVANAFDLSVQQLANYNNLNATSNLYVGQKLSLKENPTSKPVLNNAVTAKADDKASSKIRTKVYVVKRGEYLKLIADRYALSNQELADLTPGLNAGSNLFAGQKIHVPLNTVNDDVDKSDTRIVSKTAEKLKAENSVKTENYRVQRGDTLSSIAADNKISLADLAELNNFSGNKSLMAGQTIKVPATEKVPDTYVVQSGDSLIAVANKYNLPVAKLADLNGLNTTSGLFVGQKIKLTGEVSQNQSKARTSSVKSQAEEPDIHIVKSGETLASIAKKYHLQLSFLSELNGLSRNASVRAGQKLKIEGDLPAKSSSREEVKASAKVPKSTKNTEKYAVKAGESLHSIAGRVGLSVSDLAELNNLNPKTNLLRGQTILVPKTQTDYTVKSGDSLIRLANRFGVDSSALAEMNDLKPNSPLRIGTIIKVPN
ncbi:LysM peptidoglycan-binding domain-containing protein [Acinetobacter stercoris]|uniref:Membrane-bound lytic murein transglycosylase D n=1 Tax=Acinetobacter stercoris TaxID=2126983 RepID=A0A2U3MVC6_9GAMM|nr:LysM peptidoglycan-binding domain-containing protein [Acinetobacter stercoris]SPL69388.1 Membrane-bound lytic murein transglycosylase D precursor [Acinetobacter stercoris]